MCVKRDRQHLATIAERARPAKAELLRSQPDLLGAGGRCLPGEVSLLFVGPFPGVEDTRPFDLKDVNGA